MTKHLHRLILAAAATVAVVVVGATSALAMVELPQGGLDHPVAHAPAAAASTGQFPWLYVGPAIAAAVIIAVGLFLAVRSRHETSTFEGA